jgi:CheY-like chemotaxis protein
LWTIEQEAGAQAPEEHFPDQPVCGLRTNAQRPCGLAALFPIQGQTFENRSMSQRILVVDDDPASLATLSRLLEKHGYNVRNVSDSSVALEAAVEFQPHVVILDFLMPGMHGGDVAWQLASNPLLRDVRVIVSSAYSAEEIRRNLPPAKIPILPKPIDFQALLHLIQEEGRAGSVDS